MLKKAQKAIHDAKASVLGQGIVDKEYDKMASHVTREGKRMKKLNNSLKKYAEAVQGSFHSTLTPKFENPLSPFIYFSHLA